MQINQALFAADLPVERKVTLVLDGGDVVEQVVFVRPMTSLAWRQQVLTEESADTCKVEMALARMISSHIVDSDGTRLMSPEQAASLKPLVSAQMRDFIMEVSGLGKPRAA